MLVRALRRPVAHSRAVLGEGSAAGHGCRRELPLIGVVALVPNETTTNTRAWRRAQPSDRTNNALEFQSLPSISGTLIGVAEAPMTPFVVSVVPLVKLTALRTPVLWPK